MSLTSIMPVSALDEVLLHHSNVILRDILELCDAVRRARVPHPNDIVRPSVPLPVRELPDALVQGTFLRDEVVVVHERQGASKWRRPALEPIGLDRHEPGRSPAQERGEVRTVRGDEWCVLCVFEPVRHLHDACLAAPDGEEHRFHFVGVPNLLVEPLCEGLALAFVALPVLVSEWPLVLHICKWQIVHYSLRRCVEVSSNGRSCTSSIAYWPRRNKLDKEA